MHDYRQNENQYEKYPEHWAGHNIRLAEKQKSEDSIPLLWPLVLMVEPLNIMTLTITAMTISFSLKM